LVYIRNLLAVGNINENTEVCKFVVSDKEGIIKLISIFEKYNLNTTKYLDYTDFKEAFNLYHSRNGVLTEELKDKIIKLKSGRPVTVKIINDILAYCGIKITEGILKSLLAAPRFVLDDFHKKETIEILKDKIGGP